jgi:hypothetical protein
MPPHSVIARLGVIVSGAPPVLGANRVRGARPAVVTELPSLVVDFALTGDATVSRMRFVREGTRGGVPPRHSERLGGVMGVEVWAATSPDLLALSERVQDRLADAAAIRGTGMIVLRAAACGAGEGLMHAPPGAAAFAAWRQRLEYTFEYDGETEIIETDGAPIRRIDVTMDSALPDHLTIGQ